ncbi:MAG: hypothetical protein IJ594_01540 [Oscillospiraceae bacterium]|nr:hypothetical protein [Oscillospiraceae bacterium]
MATKAKSLLLGFDMGTSGVKGVVLEPVTGEKQVVYVPWRLLTPRPGYAEFACDELWAAILECVRRLRDERGVALSQVSAIGFCALCPGLIALGADGRELSNCIIFMDARSAEDAAYIYSRISREESYRILGNVIMSGATSVTSMRWFKRNHPELYAKTAFFVHMPSWAGYKLTGEVRMDLANAAGTGLYDIHGQCWSDRLIRAAEIQADKLPELAQGVDLLGRVMRGEFTQLGIPEGTPVSCGAGDTVCALLALFGKQKDRAMLMLGTSNVLFSLTDSDRFSPEFQARSFVFRDYYAQGASMSGPGAMTRWFRNEFCQDLLARESEGYDAYALMDAEAERTPPGAEGLICLPYINGERSPVFDSDARAVLVGVNLKTTRGHIARAITEGAAYGIRQFAELMRNNTGVPMNEMSVLGGGSKSSFVVQTMADVTGCRMKTYDDPDLGAVGAALTGGIAAGVIPSTYTLPQNRIARLYEPREELADLYYAGFARYQKLYPSVKELFIRE